MLRQRPGLAVVLYVFKLGAAMILALPVYGALVEQIGLTGFGEDLVLKFDLLLWREILNLITETLQTIGFQLLLVIPLYWIWNTAARMGVIYALHQGAIWPFWRGVGYYTPKGLLMSTFFLPLKVIAVVVAVFLGSFLFNVWKGEIGAFWTMAVITPFMIISLLSLINLFQRFAMIALVIRHDTVGNAFISGFRWPFRYGSASYVYLAWYGIALLIFAITQSLNALLHVGVSAIAVGFLLQQISLFTQSAVNVGWVGSEVSLFEYTHTAELPLIADSEDVSLPGEKFGEDSFRGDMGFA